MGNLARRMHSACAIGQRYPTTTGNQLGLIIAALVGYQRLVPDPPHHADIPIKGSYLADLDAYLHGEELGNKGAIANHLAFSFVRVLRHYRDVYEDLAVFLESVLETEPPLLQGLDGLSDEYLSERILFRDHAVAYRNIVARSRQLKPLELRESNEDTDWDFI